jgi:hypothetical protein
MAIILIFGLQNAERVLVSSCRFSIAPAPSNIPFWAHVYSFFSVALLGCLDLGSDVALNSFISGTLLSPVCLLLFLYPLSTQVWPLIHHPRSILDGQIGLFCSIVDVVLGGVFVGVLLLPSVLPCDAHYYELCFGCGGGIYSTRRTLLLGGVILLLWSRTVHSHTKR